MTDKVSELGFPGLVVKDGSYGMADQTGVSGFLSSLNLASTFDRDLMQRVGAAMGEEFIGKGE